MAATDRARRIETHENILALCSDIYEAVGVLAERGQTQDDLTELLAILRATARIKALALTSRNGVTYATDAHETSLCCHSRE
jgi:hypothetical protein